MIEAVIFDMDGLLIDSEPHWHKAQQTVFPTVGIDLTIADCQETTGIRIDNVVSLRYQQKPWTGKTLKEVEDAIVDELVRLMQESLVPKEGISEILDFFAERNIPTALASSSSFRIINAALSCIGIKDRFVEIHSADIEKYAKPHPAVYINTAERLGLHPQNCLAFEDSLPGVIAAKAAQMKVVAIPEVKRPGFALADRQLSSLLEFSEDMWKELNGL